MKVSNCFVQILLGFCSFNTVLGVFDVLRGNTLSIHIFRSTNNLFLRVRKIETMCIVCFTIAINTTLMFSLRRYTKEQPSGFSSPVLVKAIGSIGKVRNCFLSSDFLSTAWTL